jgi:hypothetical protein
MPTEIEAAMPMTKNMRWKIPKIRRGNLSSLRRFSSDMSTPF